MSNLTPDGSAPDAPGQTVKRARPASGTGPDCRSCGRQNDADSCFCDSCGTSMAT